MYFNRSNQTWRCKVILFVAIVNSLSFVLGAPLEFLSVMRVMTWMVCDLRELISENQDEAWSFGLSMEVFILVMGFIIGYLIYLALSPSFPQQSTGVTFWEAQANSLLLCHIICWPWLIYFVLKDELRKMRLLRSCNSREG